MIAPARQIFDAAIAEGRRPSRDEWAAIRTLTGRATPADVLSAPLLLGYQRRLTESTARHPVTICWKSRRTGATWGVAAHAALTAGTGRADGGMDVLYMGTSKDMAREFVDAAGMWAMAFEKAAEAVEETLFDDGSDEGILAFRISFASGYEIVALSSRPRSLRGRQGLAIIDEAAFVDDLPELMKAAMAFLIWGGKVVVISTHNGEANPFNALVRDTLSGETGYAHVRFDLDEALLDGLYERICQVVPKERAAGPWTPDREADWREGIIRLYRENVDEELYCIPSAGSGVFLPNALIEARMDPAAAVVRLAMPAAFGQRRPLERQAEIAAWIDQTLRPVLDDAIDPHLVHALGVDVGRHRDLTVIWVLSIARTMRRRTALVVELEKLPFEQQQQILGSIASSLPRQYAGFVDATGLGAQLAEWFRDRHGGLEIKLSTEWYRTEMPPLKKAFEDDDLSIPRDQDIASDLRSFRVIRGVATLPALRAKGQSGGLRHGDAGVALALAYAATRTAREAFGYTGAGKRGAAADPADRARDRWDLERQRDGIDGDAGRSDGLW
jgi:phage FluMu gp28-like protein